MYVIYFVVFLLLMVLTFVVGVTLISILLPYSKNKLELESNLSKILPVNCKFICDANLT